MRQKARGIFIFMRSHKAPIFIFKWTLACAGTAMAVAALAWPPLLTNLWLSLTDNDYAVPAESSHWQFRPTRMNTGSGGWWVYGEDRTHYYHFTGGSPAYQAISRDAAARCPGFEPQQVSTWC